MRSLRMKDTTSGRRGAFGALPRVRFVLSPLSSIRGVRPDL